MRRLSLFSISFIPINSLNMKWKRRDRSSRTPDAALWSRCIIIAFNLCIFRISVGFRDLSHNFNVRIPFPRVPLGINMINVLCCSKWIFYFVFFWINNVIVNTDWQESKEWPECLSYQQSRASERYTKQSRLFKAFRQVCAQSGAVLNDWNRLEVWGRYAGHLDLLRAQPSVFQIVIWYNSAFSYDVTASILVFQNDETVAMLVIQTNPVKME